MYLTAIIDVYSRAIMAWGLSNTLDAQASFRSCQTGYQDKRKA
ncbi:hypothetical protein [Mesohalobacter halotolerans]|nr:hypothetical protein [Mesohalobacter halotolerans]